MSDVAPTPEPETEPVHPEELPDYEEDLPANDPDES